MRAFQSPYPAADGPAYLSAVSLLELYRSRQASPVDVVRALLSRIERLDGHLNAFTALNADEALEQARASEARYREGSALPLDGVPVAVKDLIDTAGLRTAYGSRMFAEHVPAQDAGVVTLLRAAGGVVLGKTATHEFAMGITTDNPHFGSTRNPWAPDLVPGGSSGGSAAALAAGMVPLALGTDTAGSIRIPAAFCGVVGLKPTHGQVSTDGVFPLAPSLDHVGPMARTVADVRLLHTVIAGPTVAAPHSEDTRAADRLTVGICADLDQLPLASSAAAALEAAARALSGVGARIVSLQAPSLPPLYDTLGTILGAEAARVHRQADLWPSRRDEYGPDVRARLAAADAVEPRPLLDATIARLQVRAALLALLEQADVLLSPVSAVSPTLIGGASRLGDGPTFREQVISFTAPQSLAGLPACAIRAGFDERGVPVAVQLTAAPGRESRLLRVAELLFDATEGVQNHWPPTDHLK